MIRRYFLRILAVSPFAGLAAVQSARGADPAGAPNDEARKRLGSPGAAAFSTDALAARMIECATLAKESDRLSAEFSAHWHLGKHLERGTDAYRVHRAKCDEIATRAAVIHDQIEELERMPV
jgi:hypothetical protein